MLDSSTLHESLVTPKELNFLVREKGDKDGFEGNAQSFRVITRLEAYGPEFGGLNLTRATLNATLKYPWLRRNPDGPSDAQEKFGAYLDDSEAFDFARDGSSDEKQCLEAALMDMADGLAYSVHDFEDFVRAGLIPVRELATDSHLFDQFMQNWKDAEKPAPEDVDDHLAVLQNTIFLLARSHSNEPLEDAWQREANLKFRSSTLIGQNFGDLSLDLAGGSGPLRRSPALEVQSKFLQRLVWQYVIENPRLATQQEGQRRVVRELFRAFHDALETGRLEMLPALFSKQAKRVSTRSTERSHATSARVAADVVCSLTDVQAVTLYRRLTGVSIGSVVDLVVA